MGFSSRKWSEGGSTMKTLFASLALLVGCSNDPMEPGAGNDPGRGTNTLLVDGNVHAEPREGVATALLATDFDTDFSVRVQLNGADLATGSVTIASKLVNVPLQYDGGNQRWEGRAPGYDELYRLDIVS